MKKNKLDYKKLLNFIFIALFFSLAIFQVVHNIGKEQIKIWDESSSAQNSVEMLTGKHYLVVYHDGVPLHDVDTRPPVNLWLKVISYKIFGINEFAVRFPTIVAAILTMLILIMFGHKYLKNKLFIILILFLIGITPGYMGYHVARHGDPDTLLIFFVTSYILLFFYIISEYPKVKNIHYVLFAASVAVAGLTKSILGFTPLIGMAIFALTQKNFYKMLLDYKFHITWISAVFIFASYYIIREIIDPNYINDSILREIGFANSYPGTPKHPEFSFYFTYLRTKGFYPFFYVIPIAIIPLILSKKTVVKKLIIYSFFGAFFFWLGNSLTLMKNEWYIAPIYPYLWILIAISISEIVLFFKDKIENKKIIYTIIILLLTGFSIFVYVNRYVKIHSSNQNKLNSIYAPEREGDYIDSLPIIAPNERDFLILSTHHQRQMKFYTKKLKYYDDSYNFTFNKSYNNLDLSGKNVIVSEPDFKKYIESNYIVDVIHVGKYCKLYKIHEKGQKPVKYTYTCNLENSLDTTGKRMFSADSTITFLTKQLVHGGFNSQNSLLLNKQSAFGFNSTFTFDKISFIDIKVWYKGDYSPQIVVNIEDLNYYSQQNFEIATENEWKCISSTIEVPNNYSGQNLKIYVWNSKDIDIFVDDLIINFY